MSHIDQHQMKTNSFKGEQFTEGIILAVLVVLLIFGSADIKDLTNAPQ